MNTLTILLLCISMWNSIGSIQATAWDEEDWLYKNKDAINNNEMNISLLIDNQKSLRTIRRTLTSSGTVLACVKTEKELREAVNASMSQGPEYDSIVFCNRTTIRRSRAWNEIDVSNKWIQFTCQQPPCTMDGKGNYGMIYGYNSHIRIIGIRFINGGRKSSSAPIYMSKSYLYLKDCIFKHIKDVVGGINMVTNSHLDIEYCIFQDSRSSIGAIGMDGGTLLIKNCLFQNNIAIRLLSIIDTWETKVDIDKTSFINNKGTSLNIAGGYDKGLLVQNSNFKNNTSKGGHATILDSYRTGTIFYNNTITNNIWRRKNSSDPVYYYGHLVHVRENYEYDLKLELYACSFFNNTGPDSEMTTLMKMTTILTDSEVDCDADTRFCDTFNTFYTVIDQYGRPVTNTTCTASTSEECSRL